MSTLDQINSQIHELEKKRAEIINRNNNLNDEHIKRLEWTKECHATLRIDSLGACGMATYQVRVYGRKFPHTGKSGYITILGNSSNCYDNLLYSSNVDYGIFSTSSDKVLMQFLEQVQFKSLEYSKRFLDVLKAAEKANQRYESSGEVK